MAWTILADEQTADTAKLEHSIARRDRRIAFLKAKLRKTRESANADLAERSEIIAGLERALLTHRPVVDNNAQLKIAELQRRLDEMTALVEILDDSEPRHEAYA